MDALIRSTLGEGYRTHSMKWGAITLLFEEVARGHLTLDDVQRLAKHQEAESLFRYNENPVTTALAFGDTKCDETHTNIITQKDFNSYLEDYPLKRRHTIVRPRRASRLAGSEDINIPLHIKPDIPRIDQEKVRSWINRLYMVSTKYGVC